MAEILLEMGNGFELHRLGPVATSHNHDDRPPGCNDQQTFT